jgi:hypothetical protein
MVSPIETLYVVSGPSEPGTPTVIGIEVLAYLSVKEVILAVEKRVIVVCVRFIVVARPAPPKYISLILRYGICGGRDGLINMIG